MDKDELMDMCFPKDPKKITVREEDEPEKEWFAEARKMELDRLPAFIEHVLHDYNHDYGTVVHAVSACALAAAWAACGDDSAGITGFQAGFVMRDFVRNWTYTSNTTGLRIVDYDMMLYPQYEDNFEKVIDEHTWEMLKKQAQKNLDESGDSAYPVVVNHWKSIVYGKVPFGYRVKKEL